MKPGSLVRFKPGLQFRCNGLGLVLSEPVKWDEQAPAGIDRRVLGHASIVSDGAMVQTLAPDYFWINLLWEGKVCWEYVEVLEIVE